MTFERIAPEQYDTIDGVAEPREHPHLFGHRVEADGIAAAYARDRLHHALLIAGPAGIGKATLAFRIASHLFAHPGSASAPSALATPDPLSTTFRLMAQDAHPSLLHLTRPTADRGSGFKSAITVAEVRRVGRFLSMTSHDGGYRVVIVDPADDMNRNAANALLKNLEEPPPRTLFVLVAHSLGRLLPTIRSRCQLVHLKPLGDDDLMATLHAVAPHAVPEETRRSQLLARSGGSVREALLMATYGGLDIVEAVDAIADGSGFDVAAAYRVADAVSARDAVIPFRLFNNHVLDRLGKAANEAARSAGAEAANRLAEAWTRARQTVIETETYNLDRKQHAMSLMRELALLR